MSEPTESLIDFCNGLEALAVNLRRQLQATAKSEAKIPETTFDLKFVDEKGSRLGEYGVAYRSQNLPEKWDHCFKILKANNSLIANPLHEEGYQFRYWIFPDKYADRIFRKKLTESEVKKT